MIRQSLKLGVLLLVGILSSGCDSGQYGESTTTEPKTESTLLLTTEASNVGERSMVEGALLSAEGAAGAGDNAEGVTHFQQGHWEVAQKHFDKALATNANLPEAQ